MRLVSTHLVSTHLVTMRLVLDERNELREPMGTAKMTMTYGQPRNEIVPARFPAGRHIMVRRLFHKYASLRPLAGIRAGGDYPCSLPSRVSDQWAKTQAEEKAGYRYSDSRPFLVRLPLRGQLRLGLSQHRDIAFPASRLTVPLRERGHEHQTIRIIAQRIHNDQGGCRRSCAARARR